MWNNFLKFGSENIEIKWLNVSFLILCLKLEIGWIGLIKNNYKTESKLNLKHKIKKMHSAVTYQSNHGLLLNFITYYNTFKVLLNWDYKLFRNKRAFLFKDLWWF